MDDILVLTGISQGLKIRLTRIAKGLRQVDVAAAARVDCIDITRLEKGRFVLPAKQKRILAVLGISNDIEEG